MPSNDMIAMDIRLPIATVVFAFGLALIAWLGTCESLAYLEFVLEWYGDPMLADVLGLCPLLMAVSALLYVCVQGVAYRRGARSAKAILYSMASFFAWLAVCAAAYGWCVSQAREAILRHTAAIAVGRPSVAGVNKELKAARRIRYMWASDGSSRSLLYLRPERENRVVRDFVAQLRTKGYGINWVFEAAAEN